MKPKQLILFKFLRSGESATTERRSKGVLATANDWEMRSDLKKQFKFLEEIIRSLRLLCSGRRVPSIEGYHRADSTLGREDGRST